LNPSVTAALYPSPAPMPPNPPPFSMDPACEQPPPIPPPFIMDSLQASPPVTPMFANGPGQNQLTNLSNEMLCYAAVTDAPDNTSNLFNGNKMTSAPPAPNWSPASFGPGHGSELTLGSSSNSMTAAFVEGEHFAANNLSLAAAILSIPGGNSEAPSGAFSAKSLEEFARLSQLSADCVEVIGLGAESCTLRLVRSNKAGVKFLSLLAELKANLRVSGYWAYPCVDPKNLPDLQKIADQARQESEDHDQQQIRMNSE